MGGNPHLSIAPRIPSLPGRAQPHDHDPREIGASPDVFYQGEAIHLGHRRIQQHQLEGLPGFLFGRVAGRPLRGMQRGIADGYGRL